MKKCEDQYNKYKISPIYITEELLEDFQKLTSTNEGENLLIEFFGKMVLDDITKYINSEEYKKRML